MEHLLSKTYIVQRNTPRMLIPALPGKICLEFLPLAKGLTRRHQISVLGIIPVPSDESLSIAATTVRKMRTDLRKAYRGSEATVRAKVMASYHPEVELRSYITDQEIDFLFLPWSCENSQHRDFIESLLSQVHCETVIVNKPPDTLAGNLMIILRPGPDSELALRLGTQLASNQFFELSKISIIEDPIRPYSADEFAGIQQVLNFLPGLDISKSSMEEFQNEILPQLPEYDLILMGGNDTTYEKSDHIDPLALSLLEQDSLTCGVAKASRHELPTKDKESSGIGTISILVDKWFAENTFHSDEFRNLNRLIRMKEDRGVTISLALPTLNEEKTVKNVIQTLQSALMLEVPLLDEIVLIDSNSKDRTREIAQALEIPVYIHQEILPSYGSRDGKGEALWKSIFVTRGDLIIWIDTDIVNIHPRFVYGLVGALLSRKDLRLVKGFYRRPMKVGDTIQAGGGGRVTELTGRPLINLFYPALSGVIQPLSGEYGGTRETLERLPFSSGYGVETGLIIDVLEKYGLRAIGQVDLVTRIHHNQPLDSLSKMSFAIIQTVMRKLSHRFGIEIPEDINRSMKIIRYLNDQYFLEVEEIAERERPPMIEIREYRDLHQDRLGYD